MREMISFEFVVLLFQHQLDPLTPIDDTEIYNWNIIEHLVLIYVYAVLYVLLP